MVSESHPRGDGLRRRAGGRWNLHRTADHQFGRQRQLQRAPGIQLTGSRRDSGFGYDRRLRQYRFGRSDNSGEHRRWEFGHREHGIGRRFARVGRNRRRQHRCGTWFGRLERLLRGSGRCGSRRFGPERWCRGGWRECRERGRWRRSRERRRGRSRGRNECGCGAVRRSRSTRRGG